ncbi:MAG TPA: glycosyltransferase family 39 protein [Phycisphaerales bacterium]|nr:glycosyltransferase family 39 protein [Phycisphaerales bacterium]
MSVVPRTGNATEPARAFLDRRGALLLTLLLAAAGLAVRWPRLTQSIWFDEAFRTKVVLSGESAWRLLLRDVHNPLYNAFMYVWVRVVGDTELAIRVPGLLAGIGLILVVFRWTRERWGPAAAWWAAAWLSVSPVHVWYSCEAKNNIVTVFFTALTLWRLDVACTRRTAGAVAAAAFAGGAAIWTDFQSLLALPVAWAAWCWLLARRGEGRPAAWRVPVACAAGSLALALPLVVFKAGHVAELQRAYLRYFHWHEVFRLFFVYFPTGNALVPTTRSTWPFAALAFAPVVLPALAAGVRRLRASVAGSVVLVSVFVPPVAMAILTESMMLAGADTRLYQERNLLVMLPGLAVLLGVGATSVRWPRVRAAVAAGVLALAFVSSVALVTWNHDRTTLMYPNPDWRAAGEVVRSEGGPAPLVVSRGFLLPFRYYHRAARTVQLRGEEPLADAIAKVAARENPGELWFIWNHHAKTLPPEELGAIERGFLVVSRDDFRSLAVLRLRPRATLKLH